jgi:hypothetical protein
MFFMHHAFIDHQWELWRQSKQTRELRESAYTSNDQACSEFHYGEVFLNFEKKNLFQKSFS